MITRFRLRTDGVIPFTMEFVARDREGVHDLIIGLDSRGIGAGVEVRSNGQARARASVSDKFDHGLQGAQRAALSSLTYLGEEPMFNR